jgi:hypothetical protein
MTFKDKACFTNCANVQIGEDIQAGNNLRVGWFKCPAMEDSRKFEAPYDAKNPTLIFLKLARATLPEELKCGECPLYSKN